MQPLQTHKDWNVLKSSEPCKVKMTCEPNFHFDSNFIKRFNAMSCTSRSQDGRAVQGAAFRSQSGLPGVGSNPTSDKLF